LHILTFLAQQTSQPAAETPGWFKMLQSPLPVFALVILLFMIFSAKSKRKEDKKRDDMLKQLKRGDRIQTIGGILGSVVRAEETRVEVKVDEGNNTKMWFTRSAIHRVLEEEKSEAKA